MLMLIFGLQLGWFPISGYSGIKSLVLPVLALGLPSAAVLARLMRSEMLEVLREDYITTARAKGLKEFIVLYKHALRNALAAVVVYLFLRIPWLIGGAVVIETVFAWPGMGRLLYKAILSKDFPIVQGVIFIIAIVTVLSNLLGDIVTGLLDPRIRFE
jgi:peptide/nickel transport system permease protein